MCPEQPLSMYDTPYAALPTNILVWHQLAIFTPNIQPNETHSSLSMSDLSYKVQPATMTSRLRLLPLLFPVV